MKFILASQNKKKMAEMSAILGELGIELMPQPDLGEEIEETGTTFEENAIIKAETVCKLTGIPAIADDSGLAVDALGGAPGIYSARYAGEGATDKDRNNLLLENMKDVLKEQRTAQFVSAIAVAFTDKPTIVVRGECAGEILFEEAGEGGFGYDPLFYVEQYGKTFGELSQEVKNKISHRAYALVNLKNKLKEIL